MIRTPFVCLSMIAILAAAEPQKRDAAGDPIPPGAICRVGSTRTPGGELVWVAMTTDGSRIVNSGHYGHAIQVRDTRTLRLLAQIRNAGQGSIHGVAISTDAKRVAALIGRPGPREPPLSAVVWEVETSKLLCEIELVVTDSGDNALAFSSDGRKLAAVVDGVRVIDIASAKVEYVVGNKESVGTWLTFVGDRFVCLGTYHFWQWFDIAADKLLTVEYHRTPEPEGVSHRRLSPDGKWLVVSVEGFAVRYRVELPTPERDTVRLSDPVRVVTPKWLRDIVAVEPSGGRCVCLADGYACLADFTTGASTQTPGTQWKRAFAGAFAGKAALFVCGHSRTFPDEHLEVFDLVRRVNLSEEEGVMHTGDSLRWSADSRELIDDEARWDAATGRRIARFVGPLPGPSIGSLNPDEVEREILAQDRRNRLVVRRPSGRLGDGWFRNAEGDDSVSVELRDADDRRLRAFRGPAERLPKYLHSHGFSADGRIYAADRDGFTEVWNTTSGRQIASLPNAPPGRKGEPIHGRPATSPDGRRVLYEPGRILRVLDTRSGTVESEIALPPDEVESPAIHDISPDGRWAAVYHWQGALTVYDLHRLEPARSFTTDMASAHRIRFSPDGRKIVAVSRHDYAEVWPVPTTVSPFLPLPADALEKAWDDLKLPSASAAKASLERLARSGDTAADWIAGRVKPAIAFPDKELKAILAELGDVSFRRREAAEARLRAVADDCLTELEAAALSEKDAEVRTRIARAIAFPGKFLPVDPEALRHLRAVEVLERIGTQKARACLERLASGAADNRLTEEAASALARLGK